MQPVDGYSGPNEAELGELDEAADRAYQTLKIALVSARARIAKLDPVFDSAAALAEWWDGDLLGPAARAHFARVYPELYGLMIANSADVKGATDAV